MVGRPPVASSFVPAALRLSLTRSAWCLIVWIALCKRLDLAADQQVALAVDVQDQAVFGDLLAASSTGRADSATGRRTRWS